MSNDIVIGITFSDGELVVFDPTAGTVFPTPVSLPLDHGEFRGLAFDTQHHKLYALTQVGHWLYSINPASGQITDLGQLSVPGADIGGLAYQPSSGSLFTTTSGSGMTPTSRIVRINIATKQVVPVAPLPDGYAGSLVWDAASQTFLGYTVPQSGSSTSPALTSMFRYDPANQQVSILSALPYHTVMGLAPSKNAGRYYSWVNAATHFYVEVDPANGNVVQLANSDAVGVTSDAMTAVKRKSFHLRRPAKPRKGSAKPRHRRKS